MIKINYIYNNKILKSHYVDSIEDVDNNIEINQIKYKVIKLVKENENLCKALVDKTLDRIDG